MTPFFLSLPILLGALTTDPAPTEDPDAEDAVSPAPAETPPGESAEDAAGASDEATGEAPAEAGAETETAAMDESPAFPPVGTTWALTELDGAPFEGRATLHFAGDGVLAGQAPCNTFRGSIDGPGEAFSIGPLAATQMACPDLDLETAYLQALGEASHAEISGETLTLTTTDARQLVFAPAAAEADTEDG